MDRIVSNLLSQFIVSNFLFQTFKEKKKKNTKRNFSACYHLPAHTHSWIPKTDAHVANKY